jgi:hypothetical protein
MDPLDPKSSDVVRAWNSLSRWRRLFIAAIAGLHVLSVTLAFYYKQSVEVGLPEIDPAPFMWFFLGPFLAIFLPSPGNLLPLVVFCMLAWFLAAQSRFIWVSRVFIVVAPLLWVSSAILVMSAFA